MREPKDWQITLDSLDFNEKKWLSKGEYLYLANSIMKKKKLADELKPKYYNNLHRIDVLEKRLREAKAENNIMHAYLEDEYYFKSMNELKQDVNRLQHQVDTYRDLNRKLVKEKKELLSKVKELSKHAK